jgi:membrane protein EpsK
MLFDDIETKKGHLGTNLVTNIVNLFLTIMIGIFLVPYLVRKLGVEFYGVIPLANYFLQYLTLSSMALNSAVGRYVTIALERDEFDESKRLFNTAFWGNLGVITLLAFISIPFIVYLAKVINLPPGGAAASQFLFACAFAGLFLSLATSAFAVSTWCLNRFDLRNGISIGRQTVYLGLILILFSIFQGSLFLVGIAMLSGAIVTAVLNFFVCRWFLPHLRISWKYFEKASLKKLLSTGGWITINMIGSILYLKIDLLIINRFFGAVVGGQYAAVLQWSMVMRMLGAAVSNVFGPPLTYLYARENMVGLAAYARKTVRYLGLIMALPIGLLCGFSKPLLTLWLGTDFSRLSWLLVLLTIHLCINVAVYPLFELQTATNKVRLPGILTCIMGVANLGLALVLVFWTNMGMYGVAVAGAVMLTLKNALFTPIYGALIIRQKWHIFLVELMWAIIATGAVYVVSTWLFHLISIGFWMELILWSLPIGILYIILIWAIALNNDERAIIIDKFLEFTGKIGFGYIRK